MSVIEAPTEEQYEYLVSKWVQRDENGTLITELSEGTGGEIGVLHHELIHHLLNCVNGDSDHEHEGREWFPAYEYSGWDMCIVNYANTMEATTYVCE